MSLKLSSEVMDAVRTYRQRNDPDAYLELTRKYSTPEGQRTLREALDRYDQEQVDSAERDKSRREQYLKDVNDGKYDGYC